MHSNVFKIQKPIHLSPLSIYILVFLTWVHITNLTKKHPLHIFHSNKRRKKKVERLSKFRNSPSSSNFPQRKWHVRGLVTNYPDEQRRSRLDEWFIYDVWVWILKPRKILAMFSCEWVIGACVYIFMIKCAKQFLSFLMTIWLLLFIGYEFRVVKGKIKYMYYVTSNDFIIPRLS